MAPSTDRRFTRDLMLEAVPYSPVSILLAFEICYLMKPREHLTWSPGRMIREIIDVPFLEDDTSRNSSHPRAFSRVLISFLILHISMFFSSGLILLKSYSMTALETPPYGHCDWHTVIAMRPYVKRSTAGILIISGMKALRRIVFFRMRRVNWNTVGNWIRIGNNVRMIGLCGMRRFVLQI